MATIIKKIAGAALGLTIATGIALAASPQLRYQIGYESGLQMGFVKGSLDRGYNKRETEKRISDSCNKIPKDERLEYYGCIASVIVFRPVREIAYWRYAK